METATQPEVITVDELSTDLPYVQEWTHPESPMLWGRLKGHMVRKARKLQRVEHEADTLRADLDKIGVILTALQEAHARQEPPQK